MKLFLGVIVQCFIIGFTGCRPSFRYEKMHNFGLGRRAIQNYRLISLNNGYAYPEALPSTKVPDIALIKEPYRHIHQGVRRRNMDVRVFRKEFDYPPAEIGQRIKCESLMNCTITYISVDAQEGLPILFRGGAGYKHFTVLVRANPGYAMKGNIAVYCNKTTEENK